MRTTVELKPEHRSRLLAVAARRGEKGFSSVINEAVEVYLGSEAERARRRQRALQLSGSTETPGGGRAAKERRCRTGDLAMIVADTDVLID